jgi:hypothetical protein
MASQQHVTLAEFVNVMFATAWDRISAALAAGAILLPVWRPTLKDASEASSLIAPILGCVWLSVQIVAKVCQILRARSRAAAPLSQRPPGK